MSSNTPTGIRSSVVAGFNRWNNVAASTFSFTQGSYTSTTDYAYDGTNLINFDSNFCTNNPGYCPSVLGYSGCWTTGSGTSSYRALECDIIMNAESFSWTNSLTEAVTAHESGHNLGLSHPGNTCRSAGSSGCGPEFSSATMYWNYSYGSGNKATLELDDVAGVVYGYPRTTFRVYVKNASGAPVSGATVVLVNSAAPVMGSTIAQGGSVYGDISNTRPMFGDGISSSTYISSTPFDATNSSGYTNYIRPVTTSFSVQVDKSGYQTQTVAFSPASGMVTGTVTLQPLGPPATPTLISPANNSSTTATTITLQWNTASNATQYMYAFYGPSTGNTWTTAWTTNTSKTFTSLPPGVYYWKVKAYGNGQYSDYSTQWKFTITGGSPPDAPVLSSPANDSSTGSSTVTLQWNAASNATNYLYSLYGPSTGNTWSSAWTTGTSQTLTNLTPGVYYWKVKSYGNGQYSSYSSQWKFTVTAAAPSTPTLVSPADNSSTSNTSQTISWNAASNATNYLYSLYGPSTGNTWSSAWANGTSQTLTNLPPGDYYWKVKSYGNGQYSSYSSQWMFTVTSAAPSTPTLASPANNSSTSNTSQTISWNAVSNAQSYMYCYYGPNTGGWVCQWASGTSANLTGLQAGDYYWKVKAYGNGQYSSYSSQWKFTVTAAVPSTPTLVSPANNSSTSNTSQTISWNAASNATNYLYSLYGPSTGNTWSSAWTTGTSQTLTNLTPGDYYWKVKAYGNGQYSSYSSQWKFTVNASGLSAPALSSPANNSTVNSTATTLNWGGVSGATDYLYCIYGPNTGGWICFWAGNTSVNRSGLTPGGVYYWKVKAYGNGQYSSYSSQWKFTVSPSALVSGAGEDIKLGDEGQGFIAADLEPPRDFAPEPVTFGGSDRIAVPSAPYPVQGAEVSAPRADLSWNPVRGALWYEYQVNGPGLDLFGSVSRNYLEVEGMVPGGVYQWRVKALDKDSASAWSGPWAFTYTGPDDPFCDEALPPSNNCEKP